MHNEAYPCSTIAYVAALMDLLVYTRNARKCNYFHMLSESYIYIYIRFIELNVLCISSLELTLLVNLWLNPFLIKLLLFIAARALLLVQCSPRYYLKYFADYPPTRRGISLIYGFLRYSFAL